MGIIDTILSLIAIGLGFYIVAGIIGLIVTIILIWRFFKMSNEMKRDFKKFK